MRISPSRARQLGLPGHGAYPESNARLPRASAPKAHAPGPSLPSRQTPVEFSVQGRVIAKGRHRTVRSGTQNYTPARTRRYAERVEAEGRLAMRGFGPMAGPVRARVTAYVVPPLSWSRSKRARAVAGELMPTAKPDLDNLLKNVFDALNGVVYHDDAQIVSKQVDKVFGWEARVELRFEQLAAGAAYPR